MTRGTTTLLAVLLTLAGACESFAQDSQTTKLLTLKGAQLTLENQKGDFERALKLKEQQLMSEEEFARRRTMYLKAEVDFQQALIGFLGSDMRVSVVGAVKRQERDGARLVRVTLGYSSRDLKELAKLDIRTEELFPLQYLKEIRDVYVSLRFEGRIISDPYERHLSALPADEMRDSPPNPFPPTPSASSTVSETSPRVAERAGRPLREPGHPKRLLPRHGIGIRAVSSS